MVSIKTQVLECMGAHALSSSEQGTKQQAWFVRYIKVS